MYVVSDHFLSLSPQVMKYGSWWIYDLSRFHDFVRKPLLEKYPSAPKVWEALLKAYGIHRFSPLRDLFPLAKDFFRFHPSVKNREVSDEQIQKKLRIFFDLGFSKAESLKKFSRSEFQERWGRDWALFWEAVLRPAQTSWPWVAYHTPESLHATYEFENFCVDATLILSAVESRLRDLSQHRPYFCLRSCCLDFVLSEGGMLENKIELEFAYEAHLKSDLKWILKLLESRIFELQVEYPIWKLHLHLFPGDLQKPEQRFLFKNEKRKWEPLYQESEMLFLAQKARDLGVKVFYPRETHSYLPEDSWEMVDLGAFKSASGLSLGPKFQYGTHRPLIQYAPRKIQPPSKPLEFMERLTWFDEKGLMHERDYFKFRSGLIWKWIFRDQAQNWFEQGVLD